MDQTQGLKQAFLEVFLQALARDTFQKLSSETVAPVRVYEFGSKRSQWLQRTDNSCRLGLADEHLLVLLGPEIVASRDAESVRQ